MSAHKEHPGGRPEVGFIPVLEGQSGHVNKARQPVKWAVGHHYPVPITHFDFDALDELEDQIREAIALEQPIMPIIQSLLDRSKLDIQKDVITHFFQLIWSSQSKIVSMVALLWLFRHPALLGWTGPEAAAHCGVTKQAFFQVVEKYRKMLQPGPTPNMRGAAARAAMRQAYKQHHPKRKKQ